MSASPDTDDSKRQCTVSLDSLDTRGTLQVGSSEYQYYRLDQIPGSERLPYSLKILLENLLRNEDGAQVTPEHIRALLNWSPDVAPTDEVPFTPARVLMQDLTAVPAVVDLTALREASAALGGDPADINPIVPVELVIDHSVVADVFNSPDALDRNVDIEYERNKERYALFRWAQKSFDNFKVVPPGAGIVHQVNIEYLARVVMTDGDFAYPDTLVGTDSHTTMANGLGILGWGVGGIEAEAAMLGQSLPMLLPRVVGVNLVGALSEGATSTDLVLTITETLRAHGVVGKFVEFFGTGLRSISVPDRATIGNMSPEYGSTCAIFPLDEETLQYLRLTGRPADQVSLVEAYARAQGLWHDPGSLGVAGQYSETLEIDLNSVEPSIAGPRRPQDRIPLSSARAAFHDVVGDFTADRDVVQHERRRTDGHAPGSSTTLLDDGAVVIAAITSCTNTSNPFVMIGAALLAKKAVERGLQVQPWVKTTLAPGSKVVMDYYAKAGLTPYLEKLGFYLVGYGCTTCSGNSGPLPKHVSDEVNDADLAAVAVLSGNRNFEGRINPDVKMSYLASPPLVIAYALAGTMDIDLTSEPLGHDADGAPVRLADIWPTNLEIEEVIASSVSVDGFRNEYAGIFDGDHRWNSLPIAAEGSFQWDPDSRYVRKPPFFDGLAKDVRPVQGITDARVLVKLGDSITTDHISPAGAISANGPAGTYLRGHNVSRADFNSYGSRRGNHEVMIRGTFANARLRNQLVPGLQGGITQKFPEGTQTTIFEASAEYAVEGTPLIVLAGKEYGSGSSRDWAAKGTALLGVRTVIAQSFERIHRSNLLGMGVLPLQFMPGQDMDTLGLSGAESYSVHGVADLADNDVPSTMTVVADGITFQVCPRIDTDRELSYFRNGGILQYVLRQRLSASTDAEGELR